MGRGGRGGAGPWAGGGARMGVRVMERTLRGTAVVVGHYSIAMGHSVHGIVQGTCCSGRADLHRRACASYTDRGTNTTRLCDADMHLSECPCLLDGRALVQDTLAHDCICVRISA
eukprot:scaffold11976_cov23-Tisochrysis_lutea.AAC.3